MNKRRLLLFVVSWVSAGQLTASERPWHQWGGPDRNFIVAGKAPAPWGEEGPRVLWKQALGPGYTAVVSDGRRLFTGYYDEARGEEVVVALSIGNGRIAWRHRYQEAFIGDGYGPGPNASPLVLEGRVYMIGLGGKFFCLEAETGAVLWSHDLVKDFGAEIPWHGYAACPLVYGDTLIVPNGGKHAVLAFDRKSGRLLWRTGKMLMGYASPTLIDVKGKPQAVIFSKNDMFALDPSNGRRLWQIAHRHAPIHNAGLAPLWDRDSGTLWTSIRGMRKGDGSRAFRLADEGPDYTIEERYYDPKWRVEPFSNALRIEDRIYTTIGDRRTGVAAFDIQTGEVSWTHAGFAPGNLIMVGNKLLIQDEKGRLALAVPTENGLTIEAEHTFDVKRLWTPPTFQDQKLYIKTRRELIALAL
ncbi:MAG: PQQ-like beta-propeller repeat protein [Acidobacteriota bacterium]|nr:PQQ-like beta-propeller repeat protein [Acidobacteriota bacterium]